MDESPAAVNAPVVADTTPTDSAPVETKETVVDAPVEPNKSDDFTKSFDEEFDDKETESKSETKSEGKAKSKDDSADADETEKEAPQSKAEERKQQLEGEIADLKDKAGIDPNKEIRDLVAARNAMRELTEARIREAQLGTEQELLQQVNPETGDYFTPQEANRLASQQALEMQQQAVAQERYQLEVSQNQRTISNDVQRVLTEFPEFDEQSKEYDPEVAAQAEQILSQSLIYDDNGTIVGSSISPFTLYQAIHSSRVSSTARGNIEGQKAVEKMMATAEAQTSTAPPKKAVDPFISSFDKEFN